MSSENPLRLQEWDELSLWKRTFYFSLRWVTDLLSRQINDFYKKQKDALVVRPSPFHPHLVTVTNRQLRSNGLLHLLYATVEFIFCRVTANGLTCRRVFLFGGLSTTL